mmetsp:Transcript_59763/g.165304  ORF Transcript_59763/g.165304 Transcript_59763/m.165304 type:complete len:338 (-) Transcript_59763:44-1057(-)
MPDAQHGPVLVDELDPIAHHALLDQLVGQYVSSHPQLRELQPEVVVLIAPRQGAAVAAHLLPERAQIQAHHWQGPRVLCHPDAELADLPLPVALAEELLARRDDLQHGVLRHRLHGTEEVLLLDRVVGVERADPVASRVLDAVVPRLRQAPVLGGLQDADAAGVVHGSSGAQPTLRNTHAIVGTVVVHDNDLPTREDLLCDARDGLLDELRLVVARHNHRYQGVRNEGLQLRRQRVLATEDPGHAEARRFLVPQVPPRDLHRVAAREVGGVGSPPVVRPRKEVRIGCEEQMRVGLRELRQQRLRLLLPCRRPVLHEPVVPEPQKARAWGRQDDRSAE